MVSSCIVEIKTQFLQIFCNSVLKHAEQKKHCSSETLKEYSKAKEIFGKEYYFKVNLPFRYLKSWIQLRGNCLPVHRGQKLKKIRVQMVSVGIAEKRIII